MDSRKSAQAKRQLRTTTGEFANENKNAGLPSNDMIQRASKLLAKSSATVDEPIIKPSVKSEGYMGSTAITGGKGSLTGVMLGTLLIVIVQNSMILMGIKTFWQGFALGLLIIVGTGVSALQVMRGRRNAV